MHGRLDQKGMARMRAYLNIRPDTDSEALFVTDAGEPISFGGGRMIWRRMQKLSGVKRWIDEVDSLQSALFGC